MLTESSAESSQFRVTLFVGPQPVEGKPFTLSTVFNVKKRSWKGGIQVAVQIDRSQIEATSSAIGFPQWLAEAIIALPEEDRLTYQDRAQELFVQALSWCKLDLLLHSGITQENQCLVSDTFVAELQKVATIRRTFITTHIASELDLTPNDTAHRHEPPCEAGGLQAESNLL